ncbi:hypothetical protein [Streptomyces sp. NPDC048551]|uniref:hypothetical protein n=1 Tax=Streptomyces sp. NPDC048551 TaxID=3155758 RepID=UPI003430D90D
MKDPFGCDDPSLLAPAGAGDREAARRTVAAHATDPAGLLLLIDMLGLHPDDDPAPSARAGHRTAQARRPPPSPPPPPPPPPSPSPSPHTASP